MFQYKLNITCPATVCRFPNSFQNGQNGFQNSWRS